MTAPTDTPTRRKPPRGAGAAAPRSKRPPRERARKSRLNIALTGVLVLLALAPLGVAAAAIFPALHRPYHLDRAAHFVLFAAPILAALALPALALRRRWLALALAIAATIAAALPIAAGRPLGAHTRAPHDADQRRALRVIAFNAHAGASINDRALADWLLAQDADLVAIVDSPGGLLTVFPELATRYPHRIEPRRGRMWPVILLSKHPLRDVRLAPTSAETRTSYVANSTAKVTLDDQRTILFTAMHPYSPRTPKAWRRSLAVAQRDGEILRAAHERYGEPVIVAGDFNSTPVGRTYQVFARASALRTATWPLPATWPAQLPRALGVSIDHIWTSDGVTILSRRVGPSFRSDHRPVVMDILLPPVTDAPAADPDDDDR